MSSITLVIPAYKPSPYLIELVQQCAAEDLNIIVVNDGSGEKYQSIFDQIAKLEITILYHKVNKGKGEALKTAFRYWQSYFKPEGDGGIVTADADGQHELADIKKIINKFKQNLNNLTIGVRQFNKKNVPLRSRLGNNLTRFIFRYFLKMQLSDTQSGLRGIPVNLIEASLTSKAERYDFELEMLLLARRLAIKIVEYPIKTVYLDANKASHFNPIVDSVRVYFVFLRFASISIFSAGLDFLVFFLLFHLSKQIFFALVVGRLISGFCNFMLNKQFAFKLRRGFYQSIMKYIILAVCLLALAYLLIKLFYTLGWNIYYSKIFAEALLYCLSFLAQKFIVFRHKDDENDKTDNKSGINQ
ncbi:MAG: glycosyltransferase, partial [Pseudomonadota bacterium]